MAREQFIIKVTKKGEIIVEMDGLPPRRVKDLIEYFEETLGPAKLQEGESGGSEGGVLDDDIVHEYSEEEEERDRRRLRRED